MDYIVYIVYNSMFRPNPDDDDNFFFLPDKYFHTKEFEYT